MKRYLKLLFAASIITLFNACETDVYDPENLSSTYKCNFLGADNKQ